MTGRERFTNLAKSPSFLKSGDLRTKYEELIAYGNKHPESLEKNLYEMRRLVLLYGLPPETEEEQETYDTEGTLRGKIWKILLRVKNIDAQKYISLVEKKAASQYQKIRNDTFRTFKTNRNFSKRVPEEKLIRVLNAFLHSIEVDAFYCFSQFVKVCCPLYCHPGIEGAYAGIKLLDEILKLVDSDLYVYLISKNLKSELFAMPPILSFSASSPPLEEVLKLWDFLFAFGVHMNVVCVAAQIVCMREELLAEDKPNRLLRTLPPIDANSVLTVAVQLVRQLPDDLYEKLVAHPFKSTKERKYNTLPRNFKEGKGHTRLSAVL